MLAREVRMLAREVTWLGPTREWEERERRHSGNEGAEGCKACELGGENMVTSLGPTREWEERERRRSGNEGAEGCKVCELGGENMVQRIILSLSCSILGLQARGWSSRCSRGHHLAGARPWRRLCSSLSAQLRPPRGKIADLEGHFIVHEPKENALEKSIGLKLNDYISKEGEAGIEEIQNQFRSAVPSST